MHCLKKNIVTKEEKFKKYFIILLKKLIIGFYFVIVFSDLVLRGYKKIYIKIYTNYRIAPTGLYFGTAPHCSTLRGQPFNIHRGGG